MWNSQGGFREDESRVSIIGVEIVSSESDCSLWEEEEGGHQNRVVKETMMEGFMHYLVDNKKDGSRDKDNKEWW